MKPLPRLLPISLSEFAARAAAHSSVGGGISGLVAEVEDLASLADELAAELEFVAERPTTIVPVKEDPASTLVEVRAAGDALIILCGFGLLDPQAWSALDELRNLFHPPAGLVLLMAPGDFEHLQEHAPNLSSWLGGRVWRHSEGPAALSDTEVQQRLVTLRAAFGKTDEQVLASAHSGSLPPDPEYAEWLLLLGHGGLLP